MEVPFNTYYIGDNPRHRVRHLHLLHRIEATHDSLLKWEWFCQPGHPVGTRWAQYAPDDEHYLCAVCKRQYLVLCMQGWQFKTWGT